MGLSKHFHLQGECASLTVKAAGKAKAFHTAFAIPISAIHANMHKSRIHIIILIHAISAFYSLPLITVAVSITTL
jgi:hypothetical protein